ncbi:hypothetical protein KC349_g183 [Hortaea werneckii]|nr:hypothetical protein KC349_g183 [Hortaea werneckii]
MLGKTRSTCGRDVLVNAYTHGGQGWYNKKGANQRATGGVSAVIRGLDGPPEAKGRSGSQPLTPAKSNIGGTCANANIRSIAIWHDAPSTPCKKPLFQKTSLPQNMGYQTYASHRCGCTSHWRLLTGAMGGGRSRTMASIGAPTPIWPRCTHVLRKLSWVKVTAGVG